MGCPRTTSIGLVELGQDGRVLQRAGVLRHRLALGDRAQQAAHDLARAGLGQVVAEADVLRLGDRADLLAKTRSGKIMRRLLRVVAKGEDVTQDTSTLENPAILEQLAQRN